MSAGQPRRKPRPGLTEEQQALVAQAMPVLRKMVRGFALWRPDADEGELMSAGGEALVQAAVTYDPAVNDSFMGYAWGRAYWAMRDRLTARRSVADAALDRAQRAGVALARTLRDRTDPFGDAHDELERQVAEGCDEAALAFAFGFNGAATWAAGEDGLIARVDRLREAIALRRELSRLSEDDRRLFVLRYLEQQSFRRIAATLGVSRSTVERRARKLLAGLRRALIRVARAPAARAQATALDPCP
jgi:RNA polymerase sigma factor (sigma-70 family)